ncbi:hypothetical protein Q783_02585 [Carnobacterium inhibens subsp. gilichinskyi]|uniref:Uncharacterized protein n=1 Tax=Carnobacterium inhibens subsp. gilichinskyi TaxID=1266845 RepID=U5SCL2_9LACT|nr:hypothetical protein Q783_02585 [Carnobacterium inhibens subsp. gilichinskyi]
MTIRASNGHMVFHKYTRLFQKKIHFVVPIPFNKQLFFLEHNGYIIFSLTRIVK